MLIIKLNMAYTITNHMALGNKIPIINDAQASVVAKIARRIPKRAIITPQNIPPNADVKLNIAMVAPI